MVGPIIEPRIRPEYIQGRHVAAREFFSEEETAHVARQQRAGEHRRVGAEHLIQRNNHRTKQMSQHWRRGGHPDHRRAQRAHRHKPFFKLTAGSLNAFPQFAEKARRAAELRQDPVHGGNQHKEHHDVHDDFVNSHSPYSLSFMICRYCEYRDISRTQATFPGRGVNALPGLRHSRRL